MNYRVEFDTCCITLIGTTGAMLQVYRLEGLVTDT